MKAIGVIPARWASSRFPGKPLEKIRQKPLIQWVLEGASSSKLLSEVIVATDDQRIEEFVKSIGHQVEMTSTELPTGSDRVWQVAKTRNAEIVVNIQGDEPLLKGVWLDFLLEPFLTDPDLDMATLGRPLTEADLSSTNTAKIVLNHNQEALYFSRLPIPYSRMQLNDLESGCLKHIGLYAYRKTFLERYCQQAPVIIEKAESLEQLRALYLGARIKVVKVDFQSWGVDVPEDIKTLEKYL